MASLLVLLVDDDELSLEIAGLQLSAIGHVTEKAASGAQALQYLAEAQRSGSRLPDAIITDMQMPDMDGGTLCKRIHALGIHQPRIFAMSATRLKSDKLRDFDGFLLKPLELDSLRQTLEPQKMPPSSVVQMPEPALDSTTIQKLRTLMHPDALDELLAAFLADTRGRTTQLERFAETGDTSSLRTCAHMIKGSAAMTGASRVARLASQLETAELSPERQKVLINELRCACDAIAGTLAREERINEAHDHQIPRIG